MNRLGFLDAGRGIAILGVLGVHTVSNFSTGEKVLDLSISMGQFGVQLFYIISAYTMCYTLDKRKNLEVHYIQNFFVRRFFRLILPFWLAIAIYLGFYFADTHYFASTTSDWFSVISSSILLQGFWPTSFSSIVPGGGSIAVEVQFYLLFPIIFFLMRSFKYVAFFGAFAIVLDRFAVRPIYLQLFSLAGLELSPQEIHQFFHFYIFNQLPVFLIGVMLYLKTNNEASKNLTLLDLIAFLIFLLIFFMASPAIALISIIGAGLLISLRYLDNFPAVLKLAGERSYSLYLFHFAVINIMLLSIGGRPDRKSIIFFLVSYTIAVAASVLVSLVTKPLLEDFGSTVGRDLVRLNETRGKVKQFV